VGELLFLLSPLAVRRMRREHTRKMSKNADSEHSLEELSTLHPCFINIFTVICGYVLFEKMCSLYHRAHRDVKRRFLSPLGILPSTGFWHSLFSFSRGKRIASPSMSIVMGRVSKNVPSIKVSFSVR
jgi:hypothetical protein